LRGGGAAARRYWPDQGLINACRGTLPQRLAEHELLRATGEGVAPEQVLDGQVHLAGNSDPDSGIRISPGMHSLLHPLQFAQRLYYFNAGCANNMPGRIDDNYVERMRHLLDDMPRGWPAFSRHGACSRAIQPEAS
jgi:mannonate dehydratase